MKPKHREYLAYLVVLFSGIAVALIVSKLNGLDSAGRNHAVIIGIVVSILIWNIAKLLRWFLRQPSERS